MSQIHDASPDVLLRLSALCDNTASQDELDALEKSLGHDPKTLGLFLDYLQLHSDLYFELTSHSISAAALRDISARSIGGSDNSNSSPLNLAGMAIPSFREEQSKEEVPEPAQCPVVEGVPGPLAAAGLLSTTLHGTLGYFSSGWPVAYLIATVIFGVGLLIGAVVHVSQPADIARQSVPSPAPHTFIGRITGMVDCQWADVGWVKRSAAPPEVSPRPSDGRGAGGEGSLQLQSPVHLHDRFALSSGLLEITYDSGAKVILQGPVTYEVESVAGGFLSVGKLTARLEKNAEGSSKTSSPQPLAPSPPSNPLFAIRTPTATVTDLGTEFGVEVSQKGLTKTAVFDGKVVVTLPASTNGQPSSELHLKAGEVAQIAANVTKRIEWGDATTRFVRTIRTQHAPSPVPPLTVTDQLSLWLKADTGISTTSGNHVTAWADQSGQDHHAATDNGSPTLCANAIHGRPAVHFRGDAGFAVAGQVLTSQQFTIIAVVSDTGTYDGARDIFTNWTQATGLSSVFLGSSVSDAKSYRTARFTNDFPASRQFSTAHHFVLTAISESNDARILVNEELVAAKGARLADRNLSTAYHVGYQGTMDPAGGAFEFWRGDIAELLVYNKTLSAAELDHAHAYLNDKYGINGQGEPPGSQLPLQQKKAP